MAIGDESKYLSAEVDPPRDYLGIGSISISVEEILDSQPISARQVGIVILCLLVVALDGLDLAILGFLAPAIRMEWHASSSNMALLFSSGLIGLCIGALTSGPLSDVVGRKKVLLAAVAIFGGMSVGCAIAPSFTSLVVLRVLTGIGLGAAAPNAITLTSEYIPKRRRSFAVTAMFCGFTMGSALGGTVLVPLLTPHVGWRGTLGFTAALSILILPVLALYLPESLKYMIERGSDDRPIERLLPKIFPKMGLGGYKVCAESGTPSASPLSQLFAGSMRVYTTLLWMAYFFSLFIVYLFGNWLPSVLFDKGMSVGAAAILVGCFQIGGTVGAPCIGYYMDRYTPTRVLAFAYVIGACAIAFMGVSFPSNYLTSACMFGAGIGVSASVTGLNALTSQIYPTSSRATGISWALGFGRIGSILGSIGGALLFSRAIRIQTSFVLVALVAIVIALCLWLLGNLRGITADSIRAVRIPSGQV